jgi:hypothetical protein
MGPVSLLSFLVLLSFVIWQSRKTTGFRTSLLTATAVLAIVTLSIGFAGCGGIHNGTQTNGGTATINVVAQSGDVSQATTVSVTVQ